MRQILVFVHLVFAAVWLGCILTEALFERALLAKGHEAHLILAELHVRVDKLIEVPAIFVVLGSGAIMAMQAYPSAAWFYVMVAAGLGAIVLNFFCVFLVFKRRAVAVAGNWNEFNRLDHIQHKAGAAVLLLVLVALIAGVAGKSVA